MKRENLLRGGLNSTIKSKQKAQPQDKYPFLEVPPIRNKWHPLTKGNSKESQPKPTPEKAEGVKKGKRKTQYHSISPGGGGF